MSDNSKSDDFELPKRTFTLEFIVGVFALVGLAAFAYLAVNIAGMKFLSSGLYRVEAEFDSVSGLKNGAPVEIAGVEIGSVADISLKGTNALVGLEIHDHVTLRDDDIAMIRTKGIIGDKYVKVSPGASDKEIPKNGGRFFSTESSLEFEEVIGKFIHRMDSGGDADETK